MVIDFSHLWKKVTRGVFSIFTSDKITLMLLQCEVACIWPVKRCTRTWIFAVCTVLLPCYCSGVTLSRQPYVGFNQSRTTQSNRPSLILFGIFGVTTLGALIHWNLHYHPPTHRANRCALCHHIRWRTLNLLMALQLHVETSGAYHFKSLARWITG